MNQEFSHTTVLKFETIQNILPTEMLLKFLEGNKEKNLIFVDTTLGGAGHIECLVENIVNLNLFNKFSITIIAFDQDEFAINYASKKLSELKKIYNWFHFHLVHENFRNLKTYMEKNFPGQKIHGLYADFGVSSPQLDLGERGFSLLNQGPIDMRMDTSNTKTARHILEQYSESELVRIFFEYGEEPKARKLAKAIVQDRKINKLPLTSTTEFAEYVKRVLAYPNNSRIHPATRAFQALRIEVNNELGVIEELLHDIPSLIHAFGKVGFISFHSLEDRIIKHAMRNWQKGKNANDKQTEKKELNIPLHLKLHLEENHTKGFGKEVPRGGITASKEECQINIRSRSARLRCFEFSQERGE